MTSAALYSFLYTWIAGVVTPAVVIQSHQNAPAPAGAYVVIGFAPSSSRKIGQSTRPDPVYTPPAGPVPGFYTRTIANDYETRVEIREVNGNGDLLHAIINSVDRVDIKEAFQDAKVSYLGEEGDVTAIPALEDSAEWRKEFLVEIRLGTVSEIADVPNAINTVELINEIG